MNSKFLTELGWKTTALKSKVKDKGLQKALGQYEKIDETKLDERLKCLATIGQLATALKKTKDVAKEAVDYLGEVIKAAELEKADVTRQKTSADKAQAEAAKKEEADAKRAKEESEGEEDEEEDADYGAALLSAFQKLKGAKDVAYQFIIADAKPHCGLMVAKKISPKHKAKLTELTESKRFLPIGTCQFLNGRYVFTLEKPVAGLAKKLQDSIKNFTGKKLPIQVGTETADAGDAQAGAGASAGVAPTAPPLPGVKPALARGPEAWRAARDEVSGAIEKLKDSIRKEFGSQGDEVIADIERNLGRLDVVLQNLDVRLADSLDKARSTADTTARAAELQKCKALLAEYIKYVKSEPMIAHIDSNPFGVQTNLKQTLSARLTEMAQAIA